MLTYVEIVQSSLHFTTRVPHVCFVGGEVISIHTVATARAVLGATHRPISLQT